MKKILCLLASLVVIISMSTVCFALSKAPTTEPIYYDGVNSVLGIDEGYSYFFANGTPITIEASGDETVIVWDGGSQVVSNETNVFGGAHDDDTEMTTSVTMNGGKVNSIFGGGLHKSHVTKATVKISAGTINVQVCGGGASSFTDVCGCSNQKPWYAGDAKNSPCKVDEVELIVEDGAKFDGTDANGYSLLFGGGEGIGYTGTANITINGGSFADTYVTAGGSNGITENANLTIKNGTFGNLVQGANRGSVGTISLEISGGEFNAVYVGGETDASLSEKKSAIATYDKATAVINGSAEIKKFEPGSNGDARKVSVENVNVEIGKDVVIENISNRNEAFDLFGDNAKFDAYKNEPFYYDGVTRILGTDEGYSYFFANGTPITIEASGEDTVVTWNGGSQIISNKTNVFGGAHDDDTEMTTSVTMNGGKVNSIYGGGLHKSHVTKAVVKINGGTENFQVIGGEASSLTDLCGCVNGKPWYAGDANNSPCRVDEVELIVEDGAKFITSRPGRTSCLQGGGEGISYTGIVNMTINGGTFEDTLVTAGGSNGTTENTNLTINGGTFKGIVEGTCRGTVGNITMEINGGEFNKLYVGTETDNSKCTATYNSAIVKIGKGVVVEELLPGSNGDYTENDATKITLTLFEKATIKNISSEEDAKDIFNQDVEYKKDEVKPTTSGGSSIPRYDIKVANAENGTISPNGKVRVRKGRDQEFSFVANDGYEVSKVLVDGAEVEISDSYTFEDVRKNHTLEVIFTKIDGENENVSEWAKEEIKNAKKNGLVPDVLQDKDLTLKITRLEFAATCVKLYEKLTNKVAVISGESVFEDCKDAEVLKAYELGITNGVSDVLFMPDMNITREQMATMLARTIALTGIDTNVYTKDIKFADEFEVSAWAKNGVRYMAQENLINGIGEGKFDPKGTATREQTLAIAERTFEKFSK